MIKLKDLLTEAPQIKKVKNVSMQYFDAEYAGEMAFSGYFRKAWLYKKDNGEWFAVIITKNKNKYEIQLGKHKDKLSADKAAEKLIKRSLNKLESINEGKLKLTKDKPKKITQRIWSAPKRIMTKSAYLRMPDINKKRRDGVDYVATSIGPNRTQVYLPVIFESVNEAVSPKGWNMSKKYITFIAREVKNLQKYHRQQNEEDFLEVANYMELQLKYMKKNLNESINQKTLMKEGVDLYSHVKAVEQHLDDFRKDLDRKRGGSYESDSIEYETDRWENNSKKLKGRDKKLGMWEKKVKKSLDNLIKDFEKAWK